MSSADPPGPADQPPEGTRHDPALGAERTRLAWRRTVLTATICQLLAIRLAVGGDGGPAVLFGVALSLLCWLGFVALANQRIQAMAQVRPIRLARLATGLAGCCLGLAAGGVMLILA
jgi:hypothetical protein